MAVEEFKEKDAPFAYYFPPSTDGSRPGIYYANGYDLPSRKYTKLATTTYHEAVPGHHFQIALEQENPDLSTFRRLGARIVGGAYVEGWGLYSEKLADEMGLFRDDGERFGMLDAVAWRAARLVVDTGPPRAPLDAPALDRLPARGRPVRDGRDDRDRPLHLLAGPGADLHDRPREIERLRGELAARDGSRFDLREFHDQVLGHGSLPLATLVARAADLGGDPGLRHGSLDFRRGCRASCRSRSRARRASAGGCPRRPSFRSARSSSWRTVFDRQRAERLGRERDRPAPDEPQPEQIRVRAQDEVADDAARPAARPDAQPGVAEGVRQPAAQRLAERDREPRGRVDRAAPAIREGEVRELRERPPELGLELARTSPVAGRTAGPTPLPQ